MSKFIREFYVKDKPEDMNLNVANNEVLFKRQIEQSKGIEIFRNIFIGFCLIMALVVNILMRTEFSQDYITNLTLNPEKLTLTGFVLSNFVHFHAIHLFFNLTAIFILFNRFYFANIKILGLLVVLAAFTSSVFSLIFATGDVNVIGSSGILFGVIAFQLLYVMELRNRYSDYDTGRIKRYLLIQGFFCVMINFLPSIAWFAHLGGAVAGVFLYVIVRKHLDFSYEALVLTYYKV